MKDVFVDERMRRRGIGTKLVKKSSNSPKKTIVIKQ